ncbi:hypothetical protein V8C35DRAFT_129229 [Trichoderma chlorosporum]
MSHLSAWPRGHVRHQFQRSATAAMTMTTLEALLLLSSANFSRLRPIVAMLRALVKLNSQLGRSGRVGSGQVRSGQAQIAIEWVWCTRNTEYGIRSNSAAANSLTVDHLAQIVSQSPNHTSRIQKVGQPV